MQAESENYVRKQAQYLGRPVFLTTKMSSSGKSSSERMLFAKQRRNILCDIRHVVKVNQSSFSDKQE